MNATLPLSIAAVAVAALAALACTKAEPVAAKQTPAARGKYIVDSVGCADCHTPLKMGPNGPERDMTRHLSGHPSDIVVPPAPAAGPWWAHTTSTMTAWSGPWGTSFTANLTPDPETGTGKWDEATFIRTIRTARHEGHGREILPPMPVQMYQNMTDEDLAAIYAYLRTVPPVKNRVPQPVPPMSGAEPAAGR